MTKWNWSRSMKKAKRVKMRGKLNNEETDHFRESMEVILEHCSSDGWSIELGWFGITSNWRGFKGHSNQED